MDFSMIRTKTFGWVMKYRFALIVLLIGIVFMIIPTRSNQGDKDVEIEPEQEKLELMITPEQLEALLSQIKGAGRVEVLLTYASGERKVFHTDERNAFSENNQSQEYETVLVTDSSRSESALVAQILGPEYLGAVIVCQGADDPSVKFAVTEAVSKATALGMDRISVLKMK